MFPQIGRETQVRPGNSACPARRAIKLKVGGIRVQLRTAPDRLGEDSIIGLQIFDSSFFFAKTIEGGPSPGAKGAIRHSLFLDILSIFNLVQDHEAEHNPPCATRSCTSPVGGHRAYHKYILEDAWLHCETQKEFYCTTAGRT